MEKASGATLPFTSREIANRTKQCSGRRTGTTYLRFGGLHRRLAILLVAAAALSFTSCQTVNYGLPDSGASSQQFTEQTGIATKTGPASGQVIGTGATRVAMLLPLSAPGNGATIANEFRNAAELAIETRGQQSMELVIKDTAGSPSIALTRTQEAVREGAAIILGPVFSSSVTSAASAARPSHRVMIAYSSDPSAASPGVYLLSFLPDQVIDRTVSYAVSTGTRTFAAILPEGAYGALVERQLRETLKSQGGVLNGVARYHYNNESVVAAIREILPAVQESDGIIIPDGGTAPVAIARALNSEGVKLLEKRLIGTGQWRSSDIKSAYLQGGMFADMDETGFEAFRTTYRARFGSDPTINGGLGYDSVMLVADLLATSNPEALGRRSLERSQGFRGATGIYRFLPNGQTQRGLAVYQIQEGRAVVVDPAPQFFGPARAAQY